jgi:hypothetical protein
VVFHTITTNMRFEEDEFIFFKDRRDAASITDAFRERDRRFASIPGFDVIKRPTPIADAMKAQRKATEGK